MSTTIYVYSIRGRKGAWSRYILPLDVEAIAQLGNDLHIRYTNGVVVKIDQASVLDATGQATTAPIVGTLQWPWLDFGQPGVSKMLYGVDLVGDAASPPNLSIGWNQSTPTSNYTAAFTIPADTLLGTPVPIPISAASFSLLLTFPALPWRVNAASLLLNDHRLGT